MQNKAIRKSQETIKNKIIYKLEKKLKGLNKQKLNDFIA
jgi:hypothetical protein